jgi:hypothetical protein
MGIPVRSIAVALVLATGLSGQTTTHPPSLADTDRAIEGLRQVTSELTESLRRFYVDLGQTIARHDRGYRLANRGQVRGADADLSSGPADLMWATTQRFTSFRMLAARNEKYAPAGAADLERMQHLIVEARKRVDAGTSILRGLLVVSAVDLDPDKNAAAKTRLDRLRKAREAAEDAARQALLAFPLEQQESCSQDRTVQSAWDGLRAGTAVVSLRFERRKRVTLIDETSYRMAVTDSGIEDGDGRHIFYQEEWVQRGGSVIRFRWRVAVETATGEHILLKRYTPVEVHGELDDLYNHRDRDYLWYLEPAEDAAAPTREEIESALADVERAREGIRTAAGDFGRGIREALAQQDRLHAAAKEPAVDSGLPDGMRERLFAIRAHMAHVPGILQLESAVRGSVSQAELAIRCLEPLAAWLNRPAQPATFEKGALLDRSDLEIDSVKDAETEALKAVPPDSTKDEDSFPAIERNMIVRIRRAGSRNARNYTDIKCLQEIWRMERGMLGYRVVSRTVSLILIDPGTGDQTRAGSATKYYRAAPEDVLEEVFDEYAADEVSLGS